MNQAFELAQNEYIIFLNAGDIFFSKNSLKDIAENIKKNPNFNAYSGGTIQVNVSEKKIKRICHFKVSTLSMVKDTSST